MNSHPIPANKPCSKEHCQLGCLCESLTGELPAREHCGQADCVLECHCTGAELTRIMRVETDVSSCGTLLYFIRN